MTNQVIIIQSDNQLYQANVTSDAIVQLAIEAGIVTTIQSLPAGLGVPLIELVLTLKQVLATDNPPLADALNVDIVSKILEYMRLGNFGALLSSSLPEPLAEAGPALVNAYREPSLPSQINVSFNTPPAGFAARIYMDMAFVKESTIQTQDEYVFDSFQNAPLPSAGVQHRVNVLYRRISDGAYTRFSENIQGAIFA